MYYVSSLLSYAIIIIALIHLLNSFTPELFILLFFLNIWVFFIFNLMMMGMNSLRITLIHEIDIIIISYLILVCWKIRCNCLRTWILIIMSNPLLNWFDFLVTWSSSLGRVPVKYFQKIRLCKLLGNLANVPNQWPPGYKVTDPWDHSLISDTEFV